MKYQDIVYIAELGLKDDKTKLVNFIKKLAAEASNKKQYSLYQGLKETLNSHTKNPSLTTSSIQEEVQTAESQSFLQELPDKIWLPKSLEFRIDSLLRLYNHRSPVITSKSKLNKILLYGPPGTGKTTLGFYIAKMLKKDIEYIRVSDVISARFGETMKNLASIFHSSTNGIIFIDEFDAFAKSRTDSNDVGELKRIVSSLIQTLDFYSSSGIVIVATNLIESLDPAILRRFPYRILVDALDKEEQSEFLTFLIRANDKVKFALDKNDRKFLESMIFSLDLSTVDQIHQLVDKAVIFAEMHKGKSVEIGNFIEAVLSSDYINPKNVKRLKGNHPEVLQKIAGTMETQGFAKSHISELLGIHRNSYDKYAK